MMKELVIAIAAIMLGGVAALMADSAHPAGDGAYAVVKNNMAGGSESPWLAGGQRPGHGDQDYANFCNDAKRNVICD